VRVLRIGGRGLIYAWAKNQQDKDCQPSTYMQQNQKKPSSIVAANDLTTLSDAISECKITAASAVSLPVHENRTNFKHSDLLVPWKTKPTNENNFSTATYHRFYHVFEEGELENLIQESAVGKCISIEKSYYDQGNWCVIFMKTS
jgi:alkylated DNA repair protein alkB family protein 8